MQFALDKNKNRIQPTKEIDGYCPCCNEYLIAKMGEINIHHWCHKGDTNCNYKPMTQWHYEWQNKFPEENREVIYIDEITGEKHIADVSIGKFIFEFQHSAISIDEFKSRCEFYINKLRKKLIWVFDYNDKSIELNFYKQFHPFKIKEIRLRKNFISDLYNNYNNLLYIYEHKNILNIQIVDNLIFEEEKNNFNYEHFFNKTYKSCYNLQLQIYKDGYFYNQLLEIKKRENEFKNTIKTRLQVDFNERLEDIKNSDFKEKVEKALKIKWQEYFNKNQHILLVDRNAAQVKNLELTVQIDKLKNTIDELTKTINDQKNIINEKRMKELQLF